ncbi:MAG: ethylbenzene dehydrogenase-related protein [Desulfosarcinaceae bacterium]|nr:ethylbenzene dehydrogenase-related protein [Desulfosarcinaceae bacterium]
MPAYLKWGSFVLCCILFGWTAPCAALQDVVAVKVTAPPIIDGVPDDAAWAQIPFTRTRDVVAHIDMALKVAHDRQRIYFLVRYPDSDESRLHKPWVWNAAKAMYEVGNEREDTCVLKWAMQPDTNDLSVFANRGYRADLWFWKAHRTDPSGFADDKYQVLSARESAKAKAVTSRGGRTMYLQRKGDAGDAAYAVNLLLTFAGDKRPQFKAKTPTGSRADVRAKGRWQDGYWTIEWSRPLMTANEDDVQFDLDQTYTFGVSRYEIAARDADPRLSQPLYGAGDVGEVLTLSFAP